MTDIIIIVMTDIIIIVYDSLIVIIGILEILRFHKATHLPYKFI